MGDIQTILNSVRQHQDKKVIIHCKGGKRSNRVIQYLLEIDRFNNIYNLGGGILAYKKEIDDSLQVT